MCWIMNSLFFLDTTYLIDFFLKFIWLHCLFHYRFYWPEFTACLNMLGDVTILPELAWAADITPSTEHDLLVEFFAIVVTWALSGCSKLKYACSPLNKKA